MIHSLNHLGAHLTGFAFSMLVQSSLLIVALFLLDLALRKKVRAVVRYPLWMLVLVKMVLPPSLAAPTGLAYWLPERKIAKPSLATSPPVVIHYSKTGIVEPPLLQPPPPPPPRLRLEVSAKLLLAWLAIALGLMAWLVRRSHSVARTAARATLASSSPKELLLECRQQMGIRRRVSVKLSANAGSPAVCGLWRPVILIPQALADKLTPVQMRAVLFHELAHIQRGDVWVNYAQSLLQIFYWWHPLLWLANAHIRRVREQAVDERVMVEMGREAEAYPNTLLEVAKLASRRPMPALGLIGIVESKSALAQRIRHLLDSPAPRSAKLGFARLAAVALLGAALLPMARGQRNQPAQAAASAPQSLSQTDAIEVEVKFVSLTDAALENLLGFRPKTIAANGHFVWTVSPGDQIELLQRMERQPGVVTRSAPRVTTTTARQAQMAVDGIQPFLHSRAHTSAAFQIIPYQIGGSLDLAVSAKITETGDVGSMFGAVGRNPNEDANDSSSRATSNKVYAVNAVGYINYDVGTAQVLVDDGGSVILQNPALTGADGKRILVIVSPRIARQSASVMEPKMNVISAAPTPSASNPVSQATNARRTPSSNSPESQPTNALTRGEGQMRFASSTGQDVEIAAIIKGSEIQYDSQTGICVLTNGFVLRYNGAVLTARRGQLNSKTGEVIAEGEVTLQRGDQVLRAERLQYNYIDQKITDVAPSNSIPVLGDLPLVGRLFRSEATPENQSRKATQAESNPESGKGSGADPDSSFWMRPYVCAGFRLDLNADGTYQVSFEEDGMRRTETGTWKRKGREFILERTAGDLQYAIRRLSVDERNSSHLLWVPDTSLIPGGAIDYFVFKPADETAADSTRNERAETKAPSVRETHPAEGVGKSSSSHAAPSNSVPVLGDLPFVGRLFRSQSALASPGHKAIQAKLNRIVLPEISFNNVRLLEAIQWLAKEASDRDPDGIGVNFLFHPNVIGAAQETVIDPNTGQVLSPPPPQPLDMNTVTVRINPPLKNVRLGDAVEAVVNGADQPIRYTIAEYAVIFSEKPPNTQGLETRIFRLDPETFFDDAHRFLLDRGWSDLEIFGHSKDWKLSIIRTFCELLGVSPPKTFFYSEGTGMLMVRATAEELDRVQKAIETLNTLRQSASRSPSAAAKVGEDKVSQPDATEVATRSETIKLETRVFSVSPATLLEGLKNTSGVPPNPGTIDSIQDSIRAVLTAAGVNVHPPNAVFFNHRTGVLMVRATSTELDIVQKALELLNYRPPQITLEARFIQMPTETASELGLDLPPPDNRILNTWTRVLTAAQTRAVLHAAERHAGVDILSVPKITKLSGRQAQIQAVEIKTIVNGIAPEAIERPGVQSTNSNPAQPYLTSQIPCGPTLDVTPHVAADGYTIHLTALPQVTEFLRYDTTRFDAFLGNFRVIPRPIVRHQSMHASVDVYDGQTLVLANPHVTVVSKEPTGESVTNAVAEDAQKRLLVFITPTIIDPAGNPIHLPGKEPFSADKAPPQPAQ
jgi:beta-lactamase regulating signal transducer with metallopeptidase domain/type II secretory pathway component GspD/PulD (secretin)